MIIMYSVTDNATGKVVFVGEDKRAERVERYRIHEYPVYAGTRYTYEPPIDTYYKVVAAVPSTEGDYIIDILYREEESDTDFTLRVMRRIYQVEERTPEGFVLRTFSEIRPT